MSYEPETPSELRNSEPGTTRAEPSANPPHRRGVWWGEILGALVLGVLIVITIGAGALYLYSGTDWGHERMRRYAESFLQRTAKGGRVRIGSLSGNLLTGIIVNDFVVTDTAGQPFIAVPRMKGEYSISDLIHKRVWIDNVVLERPLLVFDMQPSGRWNWKRIFPRDTSPASLGNSSPWNDRIRFTNGRIIDGHVIVRGPWHPGRNLSKAAADSVVRDALSGNSRMVITQVPGGFQKTIELKSITASVPLLRLTEPGYSEHLAQIASLQMDAYPFRPPAAEVRGFQGSIPFTNDSVWWRGVTGRLPNSVITGDGSYVIDSGDLTLRAHGEPTALADFRWVYPRLPADAYGTMDYVMKWRDASDEYDFTNANITEGPAHISGSFGLTRGDSMTYHDTDLRFTNVSTKLIEQVAVGFKSPRQGTLSGRAKVDGGRNALNVDADVAFADRYAGTSRVVALGEVGFPGTGVRATNLRLQLLPVQVELVRDYAPKLPLSGIVTGTATVNGNTAGELRIVADLDHVDRGTRSAASGTATIHLAGATRFDVDARAKPVSLIEVGRFFPSVGLQGVASGPITIRGTSSNMDVVADLSVSGGGHLNGRAHLDLTGVKRYDIVAAMTTLNLHAILTKAPATSLSARTVVVGAGTDPATMHTSIAADFATSRWDSVAIDTASLRATISDGLAQVPRLYAAGGHATASASGAFGLVAGRTGALTYHVNIDSLAAFNRWIPGLRNDTTVVGPRPGLIARALQVARADSAKKARDTEIERIVTGKAAPTLNVKMPRSVRRDTVGGTAYAAGTLTGNLSDFDLRGRAGGEDLSIRGSFVRRFQSEYAWTNARTANSTLAVGLNADSVMAIGFALDSVAARVSYHDSTGRVEVLVRQDQARDYGVTGNYRLSKSRSEVQIADLRMRFDTSLWTAPHPSTIHWGDGGIEVGDLEVRNRGTGRVYADGLLPTQGEASFRLAIENFPVGNVMDLLQSDLQLSGQINLGGSMSGSTKDPVFRGAFGITQGAYQGATLPELHGTFAYAEQQLTTHVDALRADGLPMSAIDGRIPINLALSGVTGSRLIDSPLSIDLKGDSLPIELIPHFTTAVTDLRGRVAGSISLRGHLDRPVLTGALVVANTSVTIAVSGMHIDGLHGTVRMANDVVSIGSESEPMVGDARGPVSLRGTIGVGDWREPTWDLYAVATHAEVMNNRFGKLSADVGLALKGPFASSYLSGQVTIAEGVIRAPEPTGKHVIGAGDPALFDVIDTTLVTDRELFPMQSPMLRHMRIEVAIEVNRNTWVRTRDANVEIYTDYPVRVDVQSGAMALTGVVSTDRGDYTFLSKRFAVSRGSAMFIGSKDINPTLQITGEYQVREGSGPAMDVRVLVGGTLRRPRLALESDAQPPKSQSELLSLLAFGQPTTTLASISGSSALTSNARLSQGAQQVSRQLAGIALGVAIDQVEASFGKALATDYFNITPADVPTELTNSSAVGNFLTTTRFEGGKYLNPRTFVVGQMVGLNIPGARVQYRASEGWRYEASAESRYLLKPPTLSDQSYIARRAFGAFVIRQWKF